MGKADSDSTAILRRNDYSVSPCDCYSGSKPFPNATLDSSRLTISRSLLEKLISVGSSAADVIGSGETRFRGPYASDLEGKLQSPN